ncbi:MAG: hypothetical protein AAFR76_03950 [Planctomycetota bacterium]
MDGRLRQILEPMAGELKAWIESEDDTTRKIAAMKQQMQELGDAVKGDALKAGLRGLDEAESEALRAKKRQAAEAIAELCRPLGVRLEARDAPKKSGRKPGSGSKRQPPATT